MASVNWAYIVALGGVRLAVPEPDVERANVILNAIRPMADQGDAIDACPACGGEDVFRQPSWIVAVAAYLLGQWPFLIMTGRRRCRACGQRWRTTG